MKTLINLISQAENNPKSLLESDGNGFKWSHFEIKIRFKFDSHLSKFQSIICVIDTSHKSVVFTWGCETNPTKAESEVMARIMRLKDSFYAIEFEQKEIAKKQFEENFKSQ